MIGTEDRRNRGPISANTLKRNENIKNNWYKRYGDESVANLLPTNSRYFGAVINVLIKASIHTREDLAKRPLRNRKLKHAGPFLMSFILAMQDLAVAEMNQT